MERAGITVDAEVFFRRSIGGNTPVHMYEPTAALDAESETELLNTICSLKQEEKCILLITHRASRLHIADRILCIEGGGLIREG